MWQPRKSVENKDIIAYFLHIPVVLKNGIFAFENDIKYEGAKFIHDSKIIKGRIKMFFNNLYLASMQEY